MANFNFRGQFSQFFSTHQSAFTGTILFAIAFSLFAGNALFNQSGNHPMPIWKSNGDLITHTVSKQDNDVPIHKVEVSRVKAVGVPVPKTRPGQSLSSTNVAQLVNAKLVQELLVQQGYYFGPVDGLIGSQTKLAIVGFQASIGVAQDGVVTSALLSQLEDIGKPAAIPTPRARDIQTASKGANKGASKGANKGERIQYDPAVITRIQIGLINFGVNDIAIDGVMGNQTRSAIEQFQKRYKLQITGLPSPALINKLVNVGALKAG